MKVNFLHFSSFSVCISLVLCLISNDTFGQLIPISLEQRIDKANIIFEGKVAGKTSFWNEDHTKIYTSHIVSVYKVFKGNLTSSQVEIITQGGIVGRYMQIVSHSLQLDSADVGVFMAIPNAAKLPQNSNLIRLKAYAGLQGFIKYDLKTHSAKDPFTQYKSISDEVYPAIIKINRHA